MRRTLSNALRAFSASVASLASSGTSRGLLAARLHPALIIFCFLSGGLLFGIAGIIMAVPIVLMIRTVLATVHDEIAVETIEARSA